MFSIKHYTKYLLWSKIQEGQFDLFNEDVEEIFSNSEEFRFKFLNYFLSSTKNKKLGISFESNKRLQTPDPKNVINFWFYTPQHEKDKAPLRNS